MSRYKNCSLKEDAMLSMQAKMNRTLLDNEGDVDEYLDAFVALGGQPDKEGYISKDVLVEIIKAEFELTIDMVVSGPSHSRIP